MKLNDHSQLRCVLLASIDRKALMLLQQEQQRFSDANAKTVVD